MSDRLQDPLRDPLPGLRLAVVQTGHDPIGPREDVIGEVEPATLEHVDLDALEDDDRRRSFGGQGLVEPVDPIPLPQQTRLIQAVGHRDALAVIGDRHVLEPPLPGPAHHVGERVLAVGVGGVHVEITKDIPFFEEDRERPGRGQRDLVAPLAEFRWDPSQSQGSIDVLLGADPGGLGGPTRLDRLESVLVERPTAVTRPGTDADVVFLRSGEVLPSRPE
jgi:hypothetical protein